jgi:hypothetical protein
VAITYEPVATTTLSSAASTITFSSIPATWTDLRLVIVINGVSTANYALLKLNNTTGNIGFTTLAGNGSSAGTGRSTSDVLYLNYQATLSTTLPTFSTVDLFSYAGSTFKSMLVTSNYDKNGSGNVERFVSTCTTTSAINRIDIYTSSGTFNTGTTASLYGIKKEA